MYFEDEKKEMYFWDTKEEVSSWKDPDELKGKGPSPPTKPTSAGGASSSGRTKEQIQESRKNEEKTEPETGSTKALVEGELEQNGDQKWI